MSLLSKLQKELTTEQFNAVKDALGDDFDYDMVPRSRLNKVIKQRNQLREQLEKVDVIDEDEDEDDDINSEPSGKAKPGTAKQRKAKDEDSDPVDTQAEIDKAVNAVKLEYAVKAQLKEANARDVDLVFGLLDHEKLSFNDKGTLEGLDDQIKSLTASKDFLFETAPGGTGKEGGSGGSDENSLDAKLNGVFANYGITSVEE